MSKLVTVTKAKEEITRLKEYVEIAESYKAETLEQIIIKKYAYTNSIAEVVKFLGEQGILIDGQPIKANDVTSVIRGKTMDDLHRIVKTGYMIKTRGKRIK